MRTIIILCAILFLGCDKKEFYLGTLERYSLSFNMQIPGETSKVPTCKNVEPTRVAYTVVNSKNKSFVYYSELTKNGNNYTSNGGATLPIGNYTITAIELINGNETLYSVPDQSDGSILHYADIILPMEISLTGDTNISANAFCYDQSEPPSVEHLIEGGYYPNKLGSLFFYVVESECINEVNVTIDGYRIPEVMIWQTGTYEVAIPKEYNSLSVRAYITTQPNAVQSFEFDSNTKYDSETLLIFDYECE